MYGYLEQAPVAINQHLRLISEPLFHHPPFSSTSLLSNYTDGQPKLRPKIFSQLYISHANNLTLLKSPGSPAQRDAVISYCSTRVNLPLPTSQYLTPQAPSSPFSTPRIQIGVFVPNPATFQRKVTKADISFAPRCVDPCKSVSIATCATTAAAYNAVITPEEKTRHRKLFISCSPNLDRRLGCWHQIVFKWEVESVVRFKLLWSCWVGLKRACFPCEWAWIFFYILSKTASSFPSKSTVSIVSFPKVLPLFAH